MRPYQSNPVSELTVAWDRQSGAVERLRAERPCPLSACTVASLSISLTWAILPGQDSAEDFSLTGASVKAFSFVTVPRARALQSSLRITVVRCLSRH